MNDHVLLVSIKNALLHMYMYMYMSDEFATSLISYHIRKAVGVEIS